MSKPNKAAAFTRHLQTVTTARKQVDVAVSALDQAVGMANHAVQSTWELLYDHQCQDRKLKIPLPQLNLMAGIICRLVQSMQKLGEMEDNTREKNKILAQTVALLAGLPPELREELEREMKIM